MADPLEHPRTNLWLVQPLEMAIRDKHIESILRLKRYQALSSPSDL